MSLCRKALASLETGLTGFDDINIKGAPEKPAVIQAISKQTPDRMILIAQAMRHGLSNQEIISATSFDPWFLDRIREIVNAEKGIISNGIPKLLMKCVA